MGYAVHYIYGFKSSDFDHKNSLLIPCVSHLHIDAWDLEEFRESVQKDDLLILEGPVSSFIPFAKAAKEKGAKIVYENIDNWETSLGSGGVYTDREHLNEILVLSDLLVGTAKLLVEQLQGYCKELGIERKTAYLANAVDDELFAPLLQYEQPKDMVLGTGGFFMDKALFNSFGGFDEAYDPTCYEDTDLSLKVRHAGRELYYCPHLGVVHLPHQTTKTGSDAHTKLIYEKQRYFTNKWRELNPTLLNYIKEDK